MYTSFITLFPDHINGVAGMDPIVASHKVMLQVTAYLFDPSWQISKLFRTGEGVKVTDPCIV
jgi:hypothetical protein